MANPLLDFTDLPLFDQVRPEHVGPAIDQLLAESEAALTAAVAPDLPADWTTLSRTLDVATEKLGRAWGVVGHLNAIAYDVAPGHKLALVFDTQDHLYSAPVRWGEAFSMTIEAGDGVSALTLPTR